MPLLVSLTRKRVIYLALELDRSWTEIYGVTPKMAPSFASMDGVAWPFVDSFRLVPVDHPDDQTTQYKGVMRRHYSWIARHAATTRHNQQHRATMR